uniref:Putative Ammonium transporter n=1 Tax=Magnetococcus massalia (strain MO-1) TaxID=451514 RepID=A0A1S7LHW0_MAGMO|nr:Putative Ammonium transporter [Candidatus Magnetococcus massalia]
MNYLLAILTLNLLLIPELSWAAENSSPTRDEVNILWIMICAGLVFFMQAGFTALETGFVRAKNTINVAMKNVGDFVFAVLGFYLIGFGFMFGETSSGWLGGSYWLLDGLGTGYETAFFLFQAMFVGTAATIVSGAVAERMRFNAYIIASVVISVVIYPIFGHWVWGGGLLSNNDGWLGAMGFVDFAGSTVVHSVGAWIGLAGTLILGPRIGRFRKGESQEIPGHNVTMATVGVFIIWFGWFGFNGGSTLLANASIAPIIANTVLSAVAGGAAGYTLTMFADPHLKVDSVLNGVLGGLVGITAGCASVESGGAVMIGLTSGAVVYFSQKMLVKLKIDDPVGVIPVHGFAGAWGTLALALFAPVESLPAGSILGQLWVQGVGVVSAFIWAFGLGLLLFGTLSKLNLLRVTAKQEYQGLNQVEHGTNVAFLENVQSIGQVVARGDLTKRLAVEPNTESGRMAQVFNNLLANLQETFGHTLIKMQHLSDASGQLNGMSETMSHNAETMHSGVAEVVEAVVQMERAMEEVSGQVERSRARVNNLLVTAQQTSDHMNTISGSMDEATEELKQMGQFSQQVEQDMGSALEAAEQTREGVTSVAGSMEQIHQRMEGIAGRARVASSRSQQAAQKMTEADGSMSRLSGSAKEIGTVVDLIKRIAEQTNMLALNAAIEAAGAGEAGKGFAVVATEVKELAAQTADATKKISLGIHAIQGDTSQVSDALREVLTATHEMGEANEEILHEIESQEAEITAINGHMSQISQQTHGVASMAAKTSEGVQSVMQGVRSVSSRIGDVNQLVSETATGMQDVMQQLTEAIEANGRMHANVSLSSELSHRVSQRMEGLRGFASSVADTSRDVGNHAFALADHATDLQDRLGQFRVSRQGA